ncbi:MAG: GNAT family N-acetyltransferase [Myxococcota bacterium]
MSLSATVHESFAPIDPVEWDDLVGDRSPFLEHAWLNGLHTTNCAAESTGWSPRPITIHRGADLVGAVPAWIVTHDRGQFVYQGHWARAAEDAGLTTFPKVLVGVPFTPVTGSRLLIHPSETSDEVASASFRALASAAKGTQGVHVCFPDPSELPRWTQGRMFQRGQFQYQWANHGYQSFDDFLHRFRSRRRKDIRRERRSLADLQIDVIEGPDAPILNDISRAYTNTVERYGGEDRFLTPAFFEHLAESYRHRLVAIVARRGGEFIGGSLNVLKAGRLYGRYWGQLGDVRFLHFELCYYRAIEFCIERGISAFEPGHGGEHKFARGFEPVRTYSAHALFHRGMHTTFERAAKREADWMNDRLKTLAETSPLKSIIGD